MRKIAALLMMAGTLAAMSSPTAAAAEFNDGGVPISGPTEIPLAGSMSYSGGFNCPIVQASMTLEPGSTGAVTSYTVEPSKCVVTGTWKSLGCTAITGFTSENFNWTAHDTGTQLTITGTKVTLDLVGGAFCPKFVTIQGTQTATPDNWAAIKTVTLSGTLTTSLGTNVTVGGTLEVQGEAKGTYGL